MTDYEPDAEERTDIDERDVRALTEYLTVLENQGRVRGCDDLYEVVSASGRSYLVDAREGTCSCPDHEYRGVHCKHARRVEFATGARPIPAGVAGVDPGLGEHVSASPRAVATDGGHVLAERTETDESDDERPDDCLCLPSFDDLPCWPCYREGFESPNPDATETDATPSRHDDDGGRQEPTRSEPADFGGGESTGAVDLL